MRQLFIYLFILYSSLEACTGILLHPKDGSTVHGRTVEFGVPLDTSVVFIPKNTPFKGKTPKGEGLNYKAKYASIGIMTFDDINIVDGMNEKGLSIGAFYFPTFASYAAVTPKNQNKGLSPTDFPNWVLSQFSNTLEVRQAIEAGQAIITPTVLKNWGSQPPPFHYIIYDKNGNCLVIEPIDGKLVITENPIGSFTNSPTINWHLTNLRNYIALSPRNVKPLEIGKYTLYPLGEGTGLTGLPGDFTPPSRFVRASIFSATATPVKNAEQGIFQVFHILNNFDIPDGAVTEASDGNIHVDHTLVTVARNPQTLRYYYRTYEDQTIRMVDLGAFISNGKQIKKLSTKGTQAVVDMTKEMR